MINNDEQDDHEESRMQLISFTRDGRIRSGAIEEVLTGPSATAGARP